MNKIKNISNPLERKTLTTGNKIFAPIGVSYIKPRDKVLLELCCIVIKDLEDNGEEGVIHTEKFWLTERAFWRLANWALSMRVNYDFDCENRQSLEKIFSTGTCFQGYVQVKEEDGYKKSEIKSFYVPTSLIKNGKLELSDDMQSTIERGEEIFPKIIKNRKERGVKFVNMAPVAVPSSFDYDDEVPF